jgi:glucosylceramidase
LKFFQAYQKNGLDFWAMTAQNEPSDGYIYKFAFSSMGFTPETQAEFIVTNLGPTLEQNGFGDIRIMILDDQRIFLPSWAERVCIIILHLLLTKNIFLHFYKGF